MQSKIDGAHDQAECDIMLGKAKSSHNPYLLRSQECEGYQAGLVRSDNLDFVYNASLVPQSVKDAWALGRRHLDCVEGVYVP